MPIELIILDLDGTLVDTIDDVGLCFNQALQKHGFAPHPLEKYPEFVGGNLEAVVGRLLPEENRSRDNIDLLKESYRAIYQASPKRNTLPFPGIRDMLTQLSQARIALAIHSNKAQDLAAACVEKFFSEFNIFVVGYATDRPSKPQPYGVELISGHFGVDRSAVLYVGDTKTDIETASNAGVDCLLVSWGQGRLEDHSDPRVKKVVHSPFEIVDEVLHPCGILQ